MTRGCAIKLNGARARAKRAGDPIDQGSHIEWLGKHAKVVAYGGNVLWQGDAHCSDCARVEAIKAQASQKVLL